MQTLADERTTQSRNTHSQDAQSAEPKMNQPADPSSAPSAHSAHSAFSSGRGAGVLVILGLLLLLGGAIAFIFINSSTPMKANAAPKGPISYEAFDTILNTAQTLINQGENEKAEALFKQVLGSHPEAQPLHIQYAQFLLAQKRAKEAFDHYIAALAIGPREPQVELETGTAASMCGRLDDAVEHYQAAQAGNASDPLAPLNLGLVLAKLGRNDEAKVALLRSAELKPEAAAPAWGTLADIALRENKPDIATNYITHARELAPNATVYRVIQARAFKRSNDPTSALQQLIGLTDAEKREPGVMQTMAECYGMLNRPADAAALYADAADSDHSNGDWAFQAAVWLEKAGDAKRAADYAKRAGTLNVEGAAALAERLK